MRWRGHARSQLHRVLLSYLTVIALVCAKTTCPPGRFYDATAGQCALCPPNTYTDTTSWATECHPCPWQDSPSLATGLTGLSFCSCPEDSYLHWGNKVCQACGHSLDFADNIACPGYRGCGSPVLGDLSQWYLAPASLDAVGFNGSGLYVKCFSPDICLQKSCADRGKNQATADDLCAAGHAGLLCYHCKGYYTRPLSKWNSTCSECPSIIIPIIILAGSTLATLLVAIALSWLTTRYILGQLTSQGAAAASTVTVKLRYIVFLLTANLAIAGTSLQIHAGANVDVRYNVSAAFKGYADVVFRVLNNFPILLDASQIACVSPRAPKPLLLSQQDAAIWSIIAIFLGIALVYVMNFNLQAVRRAGEAKDAQDLRRRLAYTHLVSFVAAEYWAWLLVLPQIIRTFATSVSCVQIPLVGTYLSLAPGQPCFYQGIAMTKLLLVTILPIILWVAFGAIRAAYRENRLSSRTIAALSIFKVNVRDPVSLLVEPTLSLCTVAICILAWIQVDASPRYGLFMQSLPLVVLAGILMYAAPYEGRSHLPASRILPRHSLLADVYDTFVRTDLNRWSVRLLLASYLSYLSLATAADPERSEASSTFLVVCHCIVAWGQIIHIVAEVMLEIIWEHKHHLYVSLDIYERLQQALDQQTWAAQLRKVILQAAYLSPFPAEALAQMRTIARFSNLQYLPRNEVGTALVISGHLEPQIPAVLMFLEYIQELAKHLKQLPLGITAADLRAESMAAVLAVVDQQGIEMAVGQRLAAAVEVAATFRFNRLVTGASKQARPPGWARLLETSAETDMQFRWLQCQGNRMRPEDLARVATEFRLVFPSALPVVAAAPL